MDVTLTRFDEFISTFGKRFLERKGIRIEEKAGFDLDGAFRLTEYFNEKGFSREVALPKSAELRRAFWRTHSIRYCLYPLRTGAAATLRQLKSEGHTVCIFSSRDRICEKSLSGRFVKVLTLFQLHLAGIYPNIICFLPDDETKIKQILTADVDIMIDDNSPSTHNITVMKSLMAALSLPKTGIKLERRFND